MRDCANARAGGCRGGAAPPELSNSFECRSQCKDQAAISELVEQEQWGAEGECSPPESIALTTFKWFNRSSGVRRGSAAPPESTALTTHLVQLRCRRRLRPIFCDPQDHTLLVYAFIAYTQLSTKIF